MKQYEYKVKVIPKKSEEQALNELGTDGWLIAFKEAINGSTKLYLYREKV